MGGVAYIFRKAPASQGVFQRSEAAHIAGYRRDEEVKSERRVGGIHRALWKYGL